MNIEQTLLDNGYDGTAYLTNPSFDDAIIGITDDGILICEYSKMVEWLMERENMTETEAVDFISCDTLWAISNIQEKQPIVMYKLL